MEARPLTSRQEKFVDGVLSGLSDTEAARRAGYGPAYCKVASARVRTISAVREAIEKEQASLREKSRFDVEQAVLEVDRAIAFGYRVSNSMAVAKLLELKCKLHGLLVDRLFIETVDVSGAMKEARSRVARIVNLPQLSEVDPFS